MTADSRKFQRVVASGKELRAPSSSSRRVGWRRLARPYGSQFPNRQTNSRLPGPKQRAQTARLGKSCLNNVNYSNVFPPKACRAGFLAIPCGANPAKAPKGRSPAGISIDFAHAKRMKSLLKRAGDRQTGFDWPRAGRAPRARGGPAMLRIAGGPAGRKICPPKTALACRAAPGRQNPKAPTVS